MSRSQPRRDAARREFPVLQVPVRPPSRAGGPPLARSVLVAAVVALLGGLATTSAAPAADPPPPKSFSMLELAPDVWGAVWDDPLQDPIEGNALFVINERDVVVVDTGLFPSTGRRMAEELRKITDRPVSIVVNTHWHDDHHGGNQVYRELWPHAQIVSHRFTRSDSIELSHEPRPGILAGYREQASTYERWLAQGHDDDGKELDAARRQRAERLIGLLRDVADELSEMVVTTPDLVLEDAIVLHRRTASNPAEERTIEIRWLGLGNTRGDLVVVLPRERIAATGDLLVGPAPFGIGSHYREWIETLDRVDALDVDLLFAGHGPPLRDRAYLHQVQGLLRALVEQVDAAVADGLDLEQTRERVTLRDWRERFAQGDPAVEGAFDAFFVRPAVGRAWELVKGVAPEAEGFEPP